MNRSKYITSLVETFHEEIDIEAAKEAAKTALDVTGTGLSGIGHFAGKSLSGIGKATDWLGHRAGEYHKTAGGITLGAAYLARRRYKKRHDISSSSNY